MRQDDLDREMFNRGFEYFPGMDKAGVDGANGDNLTMYLLVAGIQEKYHKMFFFALGNVFKAIKYVFRIEELRYGHFLTLKNTLTQFDTSKQCAGFGWADTRDIAEFIRG